MRKEIPEPNAGLGEQLSKVKKTVFQQPVKPKHKVVVVNKDIEDTVHFPTIEDLPKLKPVKKSKVLPIIEIIVGSISIIFGLINSGSLYLIATQYEGQLAATLYKYQIGSLIVMVGVVIVYDAIKRLRS
jgi:hypothetical protein